MTAGDPPARMFLPAGGPIAADQAAEKQCSGRAGSYWILLEVAGNVHDEVDVAG